MTSVTMGMPRPGRSGDPAWNVLAQYGYAYNAASQRTQQVFTAGNYVDYSYDNIGQLKTARGWEDDQSTAVDIGGTGLLRNRTKQTFEELWGLGGRNWKNRT